MAKWRIVGLSFDHMHMGDLLRMVTDHPDAEICGVFDPNPARMADIVKALGIPENLVFTDFEACMATAPDMAIVCSAPADHADFVEKISGRCHIFVEKPFAVDADDARRMMRAMDGTGKQMAINWPLAWVESHVTAKRLIDEGTIGDLIEVHFYDGNRGPLFHVADKAEVSLDEVERQKPDSWWYKAASGGGSLRDYLGYGSTLGTWYMNGAQPRDVTCVIDETPGIEVDQHSITICRYESGLSKMETRWGTFTDPWATQPQPICGFVFVGKDGTIASADYADHVTVQTRSNPARSSVPADPLPKGAENGIAYVLSCLENETPIAGPLAPDLCLIGQRIIDTAVASAKAKRTLDLLP